MYKTEIVLAVYNDNINWTEKITNVDKITVYNRAHPNRIIEGSVPLPPGGGKESYTFLSHIIKNYDQLADHTIFLQGYPFDHMTHVNENNFNDVLLAHQYLPVQESAWWGGICPFRGGNLVYDYAPYTAAAYHVCFEGSAPDIYFSPGAQWIAPRECIRSKSLKLYKTLLELITPVRVRNDDGMFNQWTMEGLWNYILDVNVKEKDVDLSKI